MKKLDVIKFYLSIYEKLRQNNHVTDVCDFPRACDFPNNSSWDKAISLSENNLEVIKKSIQKYFPSKINVSGKEYHLPVFGSDLVSDIYQITILWMIHFLYEIYKIGLSKRETKIESIRQWEKCFYSKSILNANVYYRGVKNKNYDLIPSFYLVLEKGFN